MSNQSYQRRKNILKGIGVLCFLSIFGYYSYQDSMNKIMLEKSLNENAARQRAFRNKFHDSHSSPSENGNITYKKISEETYRLSPEKQSESDIFNENLDEYLANPEDELTYPPEIYDAQIDDEEDDLIKNRVYY